MVNFRHAFMFLVVCFISFHAHAADQSVIEVSAVAEKAVEPDMVSMNLEVWSKAATASRAQNLAADKTKALVAILESFKIKKEDQQTLSFQFGPEYTWDQRTNQNKLMGFRSTQIIRVTLRKTETLGKFIDQVTQAEKGGEPLKAEAGINLNSIDWETSKREEIMPSVLADAVRATRKKADEMAKASGIKIKKVHRLSHHQFEVSFSPRSGKGMEMMAASAEARSGGSSTTVLEGQIKIKAQVSAEYEID